MCRHEKFNTTTAIHRITKDGSTEISGYAVDLRVRCAQCGIYFSFIGVAAGVSSYRPMMSVDGTELRAPMVPVEPINKIPG